ncbi:MAG: adenylate/guanylate cyclase domain-containing protein [Myxococcota bacterium]|nr:adenylate/guanylate cyclase domain-containing protein [Myxococcota bacterium]
MANDDLEALFAQRAEIDRNLAEQQRELAVMFTDIVGSTQYFEQKGDIAGMQLLRRHNALLFPRVDHAGGRIIKTIGDAIMAVFDDAESAVRCAQAMQQTLASEERAPGVEPIRIRIGLHFGRAFTTEKDVFGDTVNTAARVAHEAQAQEIVVSQGVAELLAARGGFSLKPRGSVALKGKAEPLSLVAVSWRDASPESPPAPGATAPASAELFVLELQRGPSGLKVAAIEGSADQDTVKPYGETSVSLEELEGTANQFSAFLGGAAASSYLAEIEERGRALFERALSERARARLRETRLEFLRLQLEGEDHRRRGGGDGQLPAQW